MCTSKRFEKSLVDIIKLLQNHGSFNKKVAVHIDEAHAYLPSQREAIRRINNFGIVSRIFLCSATPFECWQHEGSNNEDNLFKNIFIVDVDEQFNIKKTHEYFGVRNCKHTIVNDILPLKNDKFLQILFIIMEQKNKRKCRSVASLFTGLIKNIHFR